MLRIIAGVLGGYLIMVLTIMLTFTLAYRVLGVEGSFQPDSYDVSPVWIVLSILLGLAAAVLGGWIAIKIGRDSRTVLWLAGLVIVLGLSTAIMEGMHDDRQDPVVREGGLNNREAMMMAEEPLWISLLNPFLGAVGVFLGGQIRKREPTT